MPYKPFGIRNRSALTDAIRKDGAYAFGNNGFPGPYFNEVIFKSVQDYALGTEAQVKTYGLADIWYNGTVFKDKDDGTVTLLDYDRINIVIDSMERDIVFPAVKLYFIAHSLVNMNGYIITIQDEVSGRIELNGIHPTYGELQIQGQSNILKVKESLKLDLSDTDKQGTEQYNSVWTDGTFFYCACSSEGLRTYSIDGSGIISPIDVDYQGAGSYLDAIGDGTYIYTVGTDGIKAHSIDGSGNITFIDDDYQGAVNYRSIWVQNGYLIIANETDGLRTYSFNGTTLSPIDVDYQSGNYREVWGDGTYIYVVADTAGILSYSIDGSGNLTFIDADDQGGNYLRVFGDGTYIYATGSFGIRSHSIDGSGNLTFIDVDKINTYAYGPVMTYGNFIFVDGNVLGIRIYVENGSGILKHIYLLSGNQGIIYGLWADNNFLYAAGSFGIKTYKIISGNKYYLNFTGTGSIFEAGNLITP